MLQLAPISSLPPGLFLNFPFHLLRSSHHSLEQATQLHAYSLKTGALNHPVVSSKLLSLYSDPKINNPNHVRSVFDQFQEPSLFFWNITIKCYVNNSQSNNALLLFEEMLTRSAVCPDSFTLPCVIKGCARLGAAEEGKQIHGLALKLGLGGDLFVDGSLVSMYAKFGDMDSASKVFYRMNEKDLVSWNALLDGYAKTGKIGIASRLFREMPKRDTFSWTILVDGFSKCGEVETARKFFDSMPSRNLASWNAMITGYMKSEDSKSAEVLFDDMPEKDVITWNSMITGYELNAKYKEAAELFLRMLKMGFEPNNGTLLGVLSAISGLAILGMGRWMHSFIIKNGFHTDGVVGTSLIDMYSKCGCVESALTVFQKIQKKKLGHWTAIIVGLGMHGMGKHALDLFHAMSRTGLTPHAITFLGVLNACNHAGLVDEGRHCFSIMQTHYNIEPTVEHYGCLVDILCRSGHLEEAMETIQRMSMRPNKVVWMSLLSGSRNYKNIDIGEYAARRIIELSPDTIGCYVLLSNMYASVGQWDKVSYVREEIKRRGVKKDPGRSSIEHNGLPHEFTVGDTSHPQTGEIYCKLTEMKEKLKCKGHVPDTSQVLLFIEGENEKEAELETHSERLAIAFGLINIQRGVPIRIMKNLRVCNDCHAVTKLLSDIYDREIIVRDNSRFHHFRKGSCSCKDYW